MAGFLTKKALSRRHFLRGAGAVIALPWLDAMQPALARTPRARTTPPLRAAFVYTPNGQHVHGWTPKDDGALLELPYVLEPLVELREHLTVISGLALDGGRAHGDGPGDHARAAASFLTSAHPLKTGGEDIRAGISVDQLMARKVGAATRFPSIQLGCEGGRAAGICDSGYSCAYSNTISWRTPFQPIPKEHRPRAAFERLFGDGLGGDPAAREERRRATRSILDCVREDARSLESALGVEDRRKLDEYLVSVREVETRIARTETGTCEEAAAFAGSLPAETPKDYGEHLRLMYDLLALAFQTDVTRVATFMTANEGSNRGYRFLGCPDGHHDTSHHGGDAKKLEAIRTINRWHASELARFLGRLKAGGEGGSDLLAQTLVVYGSGLSDGDRHNHEDLPILVAGGGAASIRGGRHLRCARETPLADLHLAILQRMGVTAATFGDSTGPLSGF